MTNEQSGYTVIITEPDYTNDPATHQCPGCGSVGEISAVRQSDGIIGPGIHSWIAYFACGVCGILFVNAPKNQRSLADINDPTTA